MLRKNYFCYSICILFNYEGFLKFRIEEKQFLNISIYDLFGKKVYENEKIYYSGNNTLPLTDFINKNKSGLYIVTLNCSNFSINKRIILKK